jgi:uncharacterized protein
MRQAGNISTNRNLDKMLASLNTNFTIFGGEPLLTPIDELEALFKLGFEKFGWSGIQTNGTLMSDKHIALFKKYNVFVGISHDGTGDLSSPRVESTYHIDMMLKTLIHNHITPSIITTLHKENAVGAKLVKLCSWFKELASLGIQDVNLHPLEDDNNTNLVLTSKELLAALIIIRKVEGIRFSIFDHITDLLQGDDKKADCVWQGCDPYTTPAVQGVDRDGTLSNCGRTNKDGVAFRKAEVSSNERLLALFNTPQEFGGCKDCRFFSMCKGYCPGTAIDGDWRNRTTHCETIKGLFEIEEEKLIARGVTPVSVQPKSTLEFSTSVAHGDTHGDTPHGDMWFVEVRNDPKSPCDCKGPCRGHRA